MNRPLYLFTSAVLTLLLSACSSPHGQPQTGSEPVAPDQVLDFPTLYAQNCSGCHGAQGRGGAAIAVSDPVYLAIVDKESMRKVIADGARGTSMPAFAQSAGGMLTNKQVDVITRGIFSRWDRKGIVEGATRLHIRQKLRATPHMAHLFMERIAHPATGQKVRVAPRAAPSRTIRSWLSSAIKGYVRSSSLVVLNWEHRTGVEIWWESR